MKHEDIKNLISDVINFNCKNLVQKEDLISLIAESDTKNIKIILEKHCNDLQVSEMRKDKNEIYERIFKAKYLGVQKDKVPIEKIISIFDWFQKKRRMKLFYENKNTSELEKYGVVKIKKPLCDELNTLSGFFKSIESALGQDMNHGGYVRLFQQGNQLGAQNQKTEVNTGMIRLQSKAIGFFQPGVEQIKNSSIVKEIFSSWYCNNKAEVQRATMDWIVPSAISHNGWHVDVLRDQLKCMILMEDVTIDNAPMFYAKRSHRVENKIEIETKRLIFEHGIKPEKRDSKRFWKKHAATYGLRHIGYLPDDIVENYPENMNIDSINIGDTKYENFICTGKKGDMIFFESNGFHSGNRCLSGVRKDLVLTCQGNLTFKNLFFDFLNF